MGNAETREHKRDNTDIYDYFFHSVLLYHAFLFGFKVSGIIKVSMADVQFEEEQSNANVFAPRVGAELQRSPTFIRWVIHLGIAKTEAQANGILVVIAIICILATLGIVVYPRLFKTGKITYREDLPQNVLDKLPPEILNRLPSRANK